MSRWPDLNRGDLVVVIGDIDRDIAHVPKGTLGVVFEAAEYHAPNTGPMVRFFNGCACNVYEDWVERFAGHTTVELNKESNDG